MITMLKKLKKTEKESFTFVEIVQKIGILTSLSALISMKMVSSFSVALMKRGRLGKIRRRLDIQDLSTGSHSILKNRYKPQDRLSRLLSTNNSSGNTVNEEVDIDGTGITCNIFRTYTKEVNEKSDDQTKISLIEKMVNDWDGTRHLRHELLDQDYEVPYMIVPSPKLSNILNPKSPVRPFLAIDFLDGIHPRIKMVQTCPSYESQNSKSNKIMLLDPKVCSSSSPSGAPCTHNPNDHIQCDTDSIIKFQQNYPGITDLDLVHYLVDTLECKPSTEKYPVKVSYKNMPISLLFQKLLPSTALPPPTSFECIGHIAHFNLKPLHQPYGKLIGNLILERYSPKLQTVVNKIGDVGGLYRTYPMEILASTHKGKNPYQVKLNEFSNKIIFDVRDVYWCSRLSGERLRLLETEFQVNQTVADAFCGVGALCLHAAKKLGCKILANDLNPKAVEYAQKNAKMNSIPASKFQVQCGDARDFIRKLGKLPQKPDHLVMNLPQNGAEFLDALRWWSPTVSYENDDDEIVMSRTKGGKKINRRQLKAVARKRNKEEERLIFDEINEPLSENDTKGITFPMVHVYTFAKESSQKDILEVAMDIIASNLLQEDYYGGNIIEGGDFTTNESEKRYQYLNSVLNCDIRAKEVRDVAPGKKVVCVSFQVSNTLIRHIQGDFI